MSLVCKSCRFFQSLPVVCNDRCPPQLQFINKVVFFPFVAPHDQAVQRTIEIPLLPDMWWLMSLFTGRAFFRVMVQRQIPTVLLLQTIVSPRCAWTRWSMPLPCSLAASQSFTSLSWCRDSFPWSCGPWRFRGCTWTRCAYVSLRLILLPLASGSHLLRAGLACEYGYVDFSGR